MNLSPEIRKAISALEADCAKAERAFTNRPKALWSQGTYLSPETTKALRIVLATIEALSP